MKINLDLGDTRLIIAEGKKRGMLRNQLAYTVATAFWETARTMKPVREAYWKSEAWRKRNLRYWPWYGRGHVQLTWERNYKKAARKLGIPLDKDPDLALKSGVSVQVITLGMIEGWFTNKKLGNYVTLKKSDYRNARRIINGTDKAAQIAALAIQYDLALRAEGYGESVVLPDLPVADVLNDLATEAHDEKVKQNDAGKVAMGTSSGAAASGGTAAAVPAEWGEAAQWAGVAGFIILACVAGWFIYKRDLHKRALAELNEAMGDLMAAVTKYTPEGLK